MFNTAVIILVISVIFINIAYHFCYQQRQIHIFKIRNKEDISILRDKFISEHQIPTNLYYEAIDLIAKSIRISNTNLHSNI